MRSGTPSCARSRTRRLRTSTRADRRRPATRSRRPASSCATRWRRRSRVRSSSAVAARVPTPPDAGFALSGEPPAAAGSLLLVFVGFNERVPARDANAISFVGTGSTASAALADALGAAEPLTAPAAPAFDGWSWELTDLMAGWTEELGRLSPRTRVVVCTWPEVRPRASLAALEPREWRRQVEWPSALWYSTLVAAAAGCQDGGSVVAVADRPGALDVVGHGAEVVVAEAVANVTRSLAACEGGRGVRVNTVFSALHTSASDLPGSPP